MLPPALSICHRQAVPLGIEHLDAPSVSGLLGALGLLAARRVLPTGDR
jgi:hypothetical protein